MALSPHASRVCTLYRRSLVSIRDWAVDRDLFIKHGTALQAQFRANAAVADERLTQRLLEHGEALHAKYKHPDPYILPWRPGGTMYHRNPPPPPEMCAQLPFSQ